MSWAEGAFGLIRETQRHLRHVATFYPPPPVPTPPSPPSSSPASSLSNIENADTTVVPTPATTAPVLAAFHILGGPLTSENLAARLDAMFAHVHKVTGTVFAVKAYRHIIRNSPDIEEREAARSALGRLLDHILALREEAVLIFPGLTAFPPEQVAATVLAGESLPETSAGDSPAAAEDTGNEAVSGGPSTSDSTEIKSDAAATDSIDADVAAGDTSNMADTGST